MKDKGSKHVNADVEVVVVRGESREELKPADAKKIRQLVLENLLLTSMEPYHKVQVEVERRSDGKPEALVASMLRAHTYTADIVRVNVDPDYNVKSVQPEGGA